MKFKYSQQGQRWSQPSGILELMDDLGTAMAINPDLLMLGGGNPAGIPEVQARWRDRMRELLDNPPLLDRMFGNYDIPQGRPGFMDALAEFLNRHYDWGLTRRNITVTNGSQNAFFFLFNLLAGGGRKILLPLCPEYIGYADQGLDENMFRVQLPIMEDLGGHRFKYHIDFDNLSITPDIAAICVSRPTNPSGNVLTDAEIGRLSALAREHSVPLIVDNAYGAPFPNIVFGDVEPEWDQHVVLSLSLSKLGLPGTRTGILIANESLTKSLAAVNAVVNLSTGNVGQEIVTPMLHDDSLLRLSHDVIRPFYEARAKQSEVWLREALDPDLPWHLHACEGALFLWLWCEDLPISSQKLYRRLKEHGVIVVPGDYFFYQLENPEWPHAHQCIRINYSGEPDVVQRGLEQIAKEVRTAYRDS